MVSLARLMGSVEPNRIGVIFSMKDRDHGNKSIAEEGGERGC